MSRWKLLTLVATLVLGAAGWALAPTVSFASAVPSPSDSDVPNCLIACPQGELLYQVVVRDLAHNPILGSNVTLDFAACPTFPYCGPTRAPYDVDPTNRRFSRTTGVGGVVDFNLALRGTCGNITVAVFADGVLLKQVRLALMDQNGDGAVGSDDAAIATGKIGGGDRSADVDCSGSITASDISIIVAHSGHECPLPTPTPRSSWGTLKIHYR